MDLLLKKEKDTYQKMRSKLRHWLKSRNGKLNKAVEIVLAAPDIFHLIAKLARDKHVSETKRKSLMIALAYYFAPIDLLPEAALGPIGLIEDVLLAAVVLHEFINSTDQALIRKYWAGDWDVLIFIEKVVDTAHTLVGSFVWKRLQNVIGLRPASGSMKEIMAR